MSNSPLISCRIDWSANGISYHRIFDDANQDFFTISDLAQGTEVSKIRVKCSNHETEGKETHPGIIVRTHEAAPPRISAIQRFSTAAGMPIVLFLSQIISICLHPYPPTHNHTHRLTHTSATSKPTLSPTPTPPTYTAPPQRLRLRELNVFTTASGELSHDVAFTVDDEATHPTSLLVWALSFNESLLPTRSIEIRGVGREKTVRVLPQAETTGVAKIEIFCKNLAGLMASSSLEVSVTENWYFFFPTRGYAGASHVITILGAGFNADTTSYSCRLVLADQTEAKTFVARLVSTSEILCTLDMWPTVAQTAQFALFHNREVVEQSELASRLEKRVSGTYKTQVNFGGVFGFPPRKCCCLCVFF